MNGSGYGKDSTPFAKNNIDNDKKTWFYVV